MAVTRLLTALAVLDRNLFKIPASEISDATVTATIFAGRAVYEKEEAKK